MTWYASTDRQRFTGGTGWLASAYEGGGILGSAVPSTGSNGHASPLFNDITLPAEANDEFAWGIVSGPAGGGAFTPYEDGSFYYLGPNTSFVYEGFKNYISYGTATVTINSGAGGTNYSLAADTGSYSLSGQEVLFVRTVPNNYVLNCNSGTYTLFGRRVNLLKPGDVPSLGEGDKLEKLKILGYLGSTNDMYLRYLKDNGATAIQINDAEMQYLALLGYLSIPLNQRKLDFFRSLGYTGSINDAEYEYWWNL